MHPLHWTRHQRKGRGQTCTQTHLLASQESIFGAVLLQGLLTRQNENTWSCVYLRSSCVFTTKTWYHRHSGSVEPDCSQHASGQCHAKHILSTRVIRPHFSSSSFAERGQPPGKMDLLMRGHDTHFWGRIKWYLSTPSSPPLLLLLYWITVFQISSHTLLHAKCKGVFKSLSFTDRSAWALFTRKSIKNKTTKKATQTTCQLHAS